MRNFIFIFTGIGVTLLSISGFLFSHSQSFLNEAAHSKGTVIRNESSSRNRTYYPTVSFKDENGIEHIHKSRTGSNPAKYDINEKVMIAYKKTDPSKSNINSLLYRLGGLGSVIVGIIGFIFTTISLLLLALEFKDSKNKKRLKSVGMFIEASVTRVFQDESTIVNNKSPWVIECEWINPQDKEGYIFHSNELWDDPQSTSTVGTKKKIKIDPDNPTNYEFES